MLGTLERFKDVMYRPEPFTLGRFVTGLRIFRHYLLKGKSARRFFLRILARTARLSPRSIKVVMMHLGMYMHFCELHARKTGWNPWAEPAIPEPQLRRTADGHRRSGGVLTDFGPNAPRSPCPYLVQPPCDRHAHVPRSVGRHGFAGGRRVGQVTEQIGVIGPATEPSEVTKPRTGAALDESYVSQAGLHLSIGSGYRYEAGEPPTQVTPIPGSVTVAQEILVISDRPNSNIRYAAGTRPCGVGV